MAFSTFSPLIVGNDLNSLADADYRAQAYQNLSAQQAAQLASNYRQQNIQRELGLAPWDRGATGGQILQAQTQKDIAELPWENGIQPYQEQLLKLQQDQMRMNALISAMTAGALTPQDQINLGALDEQHQKNAGLASARLAELRKGYGSYAPPEIQKKFGWNPLWSKTMIFGGLTDEDALTQAIEQTKQEYLGRIAGVDPVTGAIIPLKAQPRSVNDAMRMALLKQAGVDTSALGFPAAVPGGSVPAPANFTGGFVGGKWVWGPAAQNKGVTPYLGGGGGVLAPTAADQTGAAVVGARGPRSLYGPLIVNTAAKMADVKYPGALKAAHAVGAYSAGNVGLPGLALRLADIPYPGTSSLVNALRLLGRKASTELGTANEEAARELYGEPIAP